MQSERNDLEDFFLCSKELKMKDFMDIFESILLDNNITFKYPTNFVAYYIRKQIPLENDIISSKKVQKWLEEQKRGKNFCKVVLNLLDENKASIAEELYLEAKKMFTSIKLENKQAEFETCKKLWEIYASFINKLNDNINLTRKRSEDFHLWYLYQLSDILNPSGSCSEYGGKWKKWQEKYGNASQPED